MTDVLVFGEPLVAFYPVGDCSIADAASIFKTWGGDTSNVVLQAARLGHSSRYLTRVGNDPFGRGFLKLWEENDVDTSAVMVDPQRYTGLYFASFEGGQWKPSYYRSHSAASAITTGDVQESILNGVKSLHLSGISLGMGKSAMEVGVALISAARRNRCIVSFDINYRPPQWANAGAASGAISSVIGKGVDVLEITNEEMSALGWGNDPNTLFERFPESGIIVFKQGSKGATIMTKGKTCSVPAFSVKVKDTVGAGDSFDAAFLVSILEGKTLSESARFAAAAAALTCTGTGPLERMPTLSEVKDFLMSRGGEHAGA